MSGGGQVGEVAEQAALAQLGGGALGEVIGLFQVRLSGQDEMVDAERVG
jgi:hypothetical protein